MGLEELLTKEQIRAEPAGLRLDSWVSKWIVGREFTKGHCSQCSCRCGQHLEDCIDFACYYSDDLEACYRAITILLERDYHDISLYPGKRGHCASAHVFPPLDLLILKRDLGITMLRPKDSAHAAEVWSDEEDKEPPNLALAACRAMLLAVMEVEQLKRAIPVERWNSRWG